MSHLKGVCLPMDEGTGGCLLCWWHPNPLFEGGTTMKRYLSGLLGVLIPVGSVFAQVAAPASPPAAGGQASEVKALQDELARTRAELAAYKKGIAPAVTLPAGGHVAADGPHALPNGVIPPAPELVPAENGNGNGN